MEGEVLVPPSPNWFLSQATDSRTEDGIYVTAAFKSIVIYQVLQNGLPKVLKVFPCVNEKIQLVRLFPQASDPEFGHSLVCSGGTSVVRLLNMHTGDVIGSHKEHKDIAVSGLSWGRFGEEVAVVSVGGDRMVVWQPRHGVTRVHTLPVGSELSLVEVNPNDPKQAIVAADKTIYLVDIKDGSILTQLQGHNFEIYCIKWLCGNDSPLSSDHQSSKSSEQPENSDISTGDRGADSDNWRIKKPSPAFSGPFVASSDYGRQIFLWDLTAKRYITNTTVPVTSSSFNRKFQGKEKVQGKNHISLVWLKNELYSSTPKGELLKWDLWPGGAKYKMIHHLHSRAVYNMEVIKDTIVTSGQDRVIHGYQLSKSVHLFEYPTLGSAACTLAFCPHDVNRLAIGCQENSVRLINFESEIPLQSQVIWQNIKGKILSIAWHPEDERKLLFGTGLGQVGIADVASGRVTVFAYYHQKPVYKVEWAPPVYPEKSGLGDSWCAYSFGDREIAIRPSSDLMADPVMLQSLIPETEEHKQPKDITEFSFSPDYKYLAIGSNDGQVHIYRCSNLQLCVSLLVLRKAIQHLLWKPPANSSLPYILAVGSNESKICIFNLTSQLLAESGVQVSTQASQELCGHDSRAVWLSWSPHKPEVLASASYDHTVQLWDTNTGNPIVNYGGHGHRVFRVEFSPSDPDLMYSFAEENSIHIWKPSQLSCKTPNETIAFLKQQRSRKSKEQVKREEPPVKEESTGTSEKRAPSNNSANGKTTSSSIASLSSKRQAFKSFFPKLHSVSSKKKSFYHILILNLLDMFSENKTECESEGQEFGEDLLDELEESSGSTEPKEERTLSSIDDISRKFRFLLEKDSEMAKPEDIAYALQLYGKPLQMDSVLTSEISEVENRGNNVQADLMHCWQGSLDERVRNAAKLKMLNPFLVSCAPQVSIKLWEFASEAYAEQLVDEGDIITAATYLVNINKIAEAVELLMKHRLFREALAIAKCRLGYNEELINKITTAWASTCIYEGSFDMAGALQVSTGQIEDAARTMARRSNFGSLFIASQLYKHAGKEDLTKSIGLLALKEVCLKYEHELLNNLYTYLPELQWFKAVSICHSMFVRLLEQVGNKNKSCKSYCLQMDSKLNKEDVQGDTEARLLEEGGHHAALPILEVIREEWSTQGVTRDQYLQHYQKVSNNLSTQQTPSSVKQLWFLVSVAVCEMLLSPNAELWELHLSEALNYALSWGKADHVFHLTHALLPKGAADLSTLGLMDWTINSETSSGISVLVQLYHTSETSLLHSYLQKEGVWNSLVHGSLDDNEVVGARNCNEVKQSNDNVVNEVTSELTDCSRDNEDNADIVDVAEGEAKQHMSAGEDVLLGDHNLVSLPTNATELFTMLNYLVDFYLENKYPLSLGEKLPECLSDPQKLVIDMSLKLKEVKSCSGEDLSELLCKARALENLM